MSAVKNPYVEDILKWRDSISRLPDHHFFDLMRMYLGDIKTPYNKQSLIERLSSFLRREENKAVIKSLLSEIDILLLATVDALPFASKEKIQQFFGADFSFAELYERLMNLEERLLIFRIQDDSGSLIFKINPLLRTVINPLIEGNILLPSAHLENCVKSFAQKQKSVQKLQDSVLVAWFSFVSLYPDLCKNDGSFKKKTLSLLKETFPLVEDPHFFLLLNMALKNLGLLRIEDNMYKPSIQRWDMFSKNETSVRTAYICAAACGRFPRSLLQDYAQLVLDLLQQIPLEGFTRSILLRAGYLVQQKRGTAKFGSSKQGRFAAMLQHATASEDDHLCEPFSLERLIDVMLVFGIIEEAGIDEEAQAIYRAGSLGRNMVSINSGSLVINAGFSVTILQEIPLANLFQIVQCMDIKRLDGIAEYEITRHACMRCYDNGKTPEDIKESLLPVLAYEIPQNLEFSLDDWYKSYTSAALYKGYVLRVDSEKQALVKNMPEFSQYIKMELAPGIYLVDFASDEEANTVFKKAGFDFIGGVKSTHEQQNAIPLPSVRFKENSKVFTQPSVENAVSSRHEKIENMGTYLESLRSRVRKSDFSEEQKDGLFSRIDRRIIVNADQLRADSVRPEKIEATGMDFLGKIHVVEHALNAKSFIEIAVNKAAAVDGNDVLLGLPLSLERHDGDTCVKIKLEPSGEDSLVSLGQAKSVRRIRGAIFKEGEY